MALIDGRCDPGVAWIEELKQTAPGKPIHVFVLCPSSSEKADAQSSR
jgi:hypothetical protein